MPKLKRIFDTAADDGVDFIQGQLGPIDPRFDPRKLAIPRLEALDPKFSSRGTLDDIPRMSLESLEGRPFVTTYSDRVRAGGQLEGLNDIEFNWPVNMQGGQDWMFENPGQVWASGLNVVSPIMRAANLFDNPLYIPWRMAPTGSDFNKGTGETFFAAAQAAMSPAEKKSFDKAMREFRTTGSMRDGKRINADLGIEWPGIDDPNAIDVWRSTPDPVRKEFQIKVLDKFRDKGGISIGEVRAAIADPSQLGARDAGLQNVGEIFTGQDMIPDSGHVSYPFGVPGQGLGRLDDQPMTIFDLVPDARLGANQRLVSETVDPLNPSDADIRALGMKPYAGFITEDILRALDDRGVNLKSLGIGATGLAAAGLAPEEAEAGPATSLVDLILRKYGDDVAGATDELVRVGGFPESVARRIATGELPMDEASKAARAAEQGYGDVLYHGSTHDITEFNGGQGNTNNDWGLGTYLSDSTHDVSKNYAGIGPDLMARLHMHADDNWFQTDLFSGDEPRTIGGKAFTKSEWEDLEYNDKMEYLLKDARKEIGGPHEGAMYPVRVKQDGLLRIDDTIPLPNYLEQAAEQLGFDPEKIGRYDEEIEYEIEDLAGQLEWDNFDSPNALMFEAGRELDADMRNAYSLEEGQTWNDARRMLEDSDIYGESDTGAHHPAAAILARTMQKGGATGIEDYTTESRFKNMEAGQHTVMFPGSEDQIRSANAAFDPLYTGKNIMGGLAAGTFGVGALMDSEEAEAGPLRVWHGSPHLFDRFSRAYKGTGEGAQMYGDGIYVAQNPGIATWYRDTTSPQWFETAAGEKFDPYTIQQDVVRRDLVNSKGNIDLALDTARAQIGLQTALRDKLGQPGYPKHYVLDTMVEDMINRDIDLLTGLKDSGGIRQRTDGYLYEVDMLADPENMLQWDELVDDQPQGVLDSLERQDWFEPMVDDIYSNLDNPSGAHVLRWLEEDGPDWASNALEQAGLKGVRYADANTRFKTGEKSYNYSVFDPDDLNIVGRERGAANVKLLSGLAGGGGSLAVGFLNNAEAALPTDVEHSDEVKYGTISGISDWRNDLVNDLQARTGLNEAWSKFAVGAMDFLPGAWTAAALNDYTDATRNKDASGQAWAAGELGVGLVGGPLGVKLYRGIKNAPKAFDNWLDELDIDFTEPPKWLDPSP